VKNYQTKPPRRLACGIWILGASFFLLGFFHRVAPGVLTRELTHAFELTATSLGGLSSLYFYAYVAMQIPTGMLVDRIGPRRLLIFGGLITALGTVLFAFAPTLLWAGVGRFIIGGSVAVAFVSTLKLTAHWFPENRYSLATGFLLVAGMIGAIFAGVPLQWLSDTFGWRSVIGWSASIGILICFIANWLVRDDPTERGYKSYYFASPTSPTIGMFAGLRKVLAYRNTWIMTLVPGGVVGAVLAFAGLWGVPFLTDIYNLSPALAATLCSGVMLSWAVGGPFFSVISERLFRRRSLYLLGTVLALFSWLIVLLIPNLPIWMLASFLLCAGLFSGGMVLGFSLAKESVPSSLSGTVTGLVNAGVMCGPMLLQPIVGRFLDSMWDGRLEGSIRIYDAAAYRVGFSVMLVWLVISVLLLIVARESFCRQIVE